MIRVTRFVKRMWLLLAVLAVASVAGFGIYRLHGMFGVHGHPVVRVKADRDIPPYNPKRVTYEIFGPAASARIAYLDPDARVQQLESVPLPWSQTVTTTLTAITVNLEAQSSGDMLGCRIMVNGAIKDERSVTGPKALTYCEVAGG
jgi:Mycobacterium membrane protein